MQYYAVIDTNVVVSAMLKEGSIPWQILDLIVDQIIIPIYNKQIMEEYEEVLLRNKFGFSKAKVKMTLALIKDFGKEMQPIEIQEVIRDKSDINFSKLLCRPEDMMRHI